MHGRSDFEKAALCMSMLNKQLYVSANSSFQKQAGVDLMLFYFVSMFLSLLFLNPHTLKK